MIIKRAVKLDKSFSNAAELCHNQFFGLFCEVQLESLDQGRKGGRLYRPASRLPLFAPGVLGRARVVAEGGAEWAFFVVQMAKWSVWRSPVTLPLCWAEELTATGVRCSSSMPVIRQACSESSSVIRPFNEVPGLWKNGWANLYNFWKLDGFRNLHRLTLQNFNTFGPIYR